MIVNKLKFSDIKEELQDALKMKLASAPIPHENGFALIEGFMTLIIQGEVSNMEIPGAPNVPAVGIVGNSSGRIYTFALKAILPDVQI